MRILRLTTAWILAFLLPLAAGSVSADETSTAWPPPTAQPPAPPSPYNVAWPAPGQDMTRSTPIPQESTVAPAATASPAAVVTAEPPRIEQLVSSTWYFRQESFWWNERAFGHDFVNEYGPLSTLGYVRRNNFERFRLELFGGTVAYDGGAQYEDGTYESYHQSIGTNYLGVRGEYDLLIEPACWSRVRGIVGIGTQFWFRDLRDAVTPSGNPVGGYREEWWTFFPYIGLETKEPDEPGWKLFGSARVGLTPLTYQRVTDFDTTLYPRCGVTAQAQFGVRFQRLWVGSYIEAMTWARSGINRDAYQPESKMLTVGGQLGYTF
jgi:hypothetical protein